MGINSSTITGDELRTRIDRLGLRYNEAAMRLGLTINGLQKQMRGERRVGRPRCCSAMSRRKDAAGRAGRGNAVPD